MSYIKQKNMIRLFVLLFFFTGIVFFPVAVFPDGLQENSVTEKIRIEISKSFIFRSSREITRLSIANPSLADVTMISPTQALIVAKDQVGTTNLIIWHGDDLCEVYDVAVYVPSHLIDIIEQQIVQLVPGADVKVSIANEAVILSGEVQSVQMLERVIKIAESYVPGIKNLITVRGSHQVQLDVTISEVNRSAMKKMGLGYLINRDWTIGVANNGFSGSGTLSSQSSSQDSDTVGSDLSSGLGLESPFASAFQVLMYSKHDDVLGMMSILKNQGLAKILANPTLISMSGQEADFNVGGEFPIPITSTLGSTTIEYREFGIKLIFTPMVVAKDTITMNVATEISTPDYSLGVMSGGVSVPGLKNRKASSVIQLKDGQTFTMAGLFKEELSAIKNKIPYVGDIPVIGALFTSKEYQRNETELVIVVTTHLVRPLNKHEVTPLPHEQFDLKLDDNEFFFFNAQKATGLKSSGPSDEPLFIGKTGYCENYKDISGLIKNP